MKTRRTPAAWRFWSARRSPSNKRRRRGVVTKTAWTSSRVAGCMPGGSSPMAFGAGIIRHAPQSHGTTRDNDMTTFLLYQADGDTLSGGVANVKLSPHERIGLPKGSISAIPGQHVTRLITIIYVRSFSRP